MKNNKLKIITITLLIILISIVSFVGVYTKNKNKMENGVKDYEYATDLGNSRTIMLNLSQDNSDEDKTEDNYKLSKRIIEQRLENLNNTIQQEYETNSDIESIKVKPEDYEVTVSESTGNISVRIPENEDTEYIASLLTQKGTFEIVDDETKEVMLNKDNIEKCYVTTYSAGSNTEVSFKIEFNGEGKKKIEEMKNAVVEEKKDDSEEGKKEENKTAEATKTTEESKEKTYTMKINGEDSYSSTTDKLFTDNIITLTMGQSTNDKEQIKTNLAKTQNLIAFLSTEDMPLTYERAEDVSVKGLNETEISTVLSIIVMAICIVAFIILAIKYKKDGLACAISNVGFAALLLLLVRYGNIVISTEGIIAIFMGLLLNYICVDKLLKNIKDEKDNKKAELKNIINSTIKDITIKFIPLYIISIVFAFTKRTPANSFGMVMFWSVTLVILYNLTITKLLLKYGKQK